MNVVCFPSHFQMTSSSLDDVRAAFLAGTAKLTERSNDVGASELIDQSLIFLIDILPQCCELSDDDKKVVKDCCRTSLFFWPLGLTH